MKYHITITDNETGEIELDLDAEAIFASVQSGNDTHSILIAECDGPHYAATIMGLLGIEDAIEAEDPVIYKRAKKAYKKNKKSKGE